MSFHDEGALQGHVQLGCVDGAVLSKLGCVDGAVLSCSCLGLESYSGDRSHISFASLRQEKEHKLKLWVRISSGDLGGARKV